MWSKHYQAMNVVDSLALLKIIINHKQQLKKPNRRKTMVKLDNSDFYQKMAVEPLASAMGI